MNNVFKLLVLAVLVTACSTVNHADFEKNTAAAKKYFELHQAEKSAEMFEMIHDDLSGHMPVYGSEMADAQGLKDALVNYQKEFDKITKQMKEALTTRSAPSKTGSKKKTRNIRRKSIGGTRKR